MVLRRRTEKRHETSEPDSRISRSAGEGAQSDSIRLITSIAFTADIPGVARDKRNSGANDDAPRKWYQVRNPLWVIVMAMAFQFSVMALIVALG